MSLIKCSECWNDISDKAENCPHCGRKIEKKERRKKIEYYN